jgi:hydroxyacylglutathione hydrolase
MEIHPITLRFLFTVNCYLLKTETSQILIDTGIKKRREELEAKLKEAGCEPGSLKLIVLTHGHIDHSGNAAYLRNKYGSAIVMHSSDVKMVTSGNMFIDSNGIIKGVVGFFMKLLGLADFERFTPDKYLQDGETLLAYGLDATVIHTPGHSNGSICILTSEGDLFCGDLFSNDKKPEKTSIIQDRALLENSLKQLKNMNVSTVYPGHGKTFKINELQ